MWHKAAKNFTISELVGKSGDSRAVSIGFWQQWYTDIIKNQIYKF
jgi:hypothetical protein